MTGLWAITLRYSARSAACLFAHVSDMTARLRGSLVGSVETAAIAIARWELSDWITCQIANA
jgi:hypothetical protein